MKKAGIAAIAAAGIVVLGGGAWAATTLPVNDEGTAAVVETAAPTPEASATPEATPTAEPTPEVEHSDLEQLFIDWARPEVSSYVENIPDIDTMTDEELLDALYAACTALEAPIPEHNIDVIGGMPDLDDYGNLTSPSPEGYARLNLNELFVGAARLGPDGATGPQSYCDAI